MPECVIFDLNGTLVDDEALHKRAWQGVAERHGVHLSDSRYATSVSGLSRRDAVLSIFGTSIDNRYLENICAEKYKLFCEIIPEDLQPVEGAHEFIRCLRANGIFVALGTSASKDTTALLLERLELTDGFDTIVTAQDVGRAKPEPDIFLEIAIRLNCRPSACVVFEDTVVGVKSARKAGMSCVGVITSQSSAALESAGAAFTILRYYDVICDAI